jgi:acyl carrier protein
VSDQEILGLIRTAVAQAIPEKAAEVDKFDLDAPLSSLGLDSIGLIETAAHIEDTLGIDFPDDQLARVESVKDFAALISARLPPGSGLGIGSAR